MHAAQMAAAHEEACSTRIVLIFRGRQSANFSRSWRWPSCSGFAKALFLTYQEDDLYATALTPESLNDRRAVRPLIQALLEDGNPHRRHAAGRARTAAPAPARCLMDPSDPQPARQEAAESLAYVGRRDTVEPLVSVLHDPDVWVRFWAVFGLGRSCSAETQAVQALESMLDDDGIPPGNWWSVGKEALAMPGSMQPPVTDCVGTRGYTRLETNEAATWQRLPCSNRAEYPPAPLGHRFILRPRSQIYSSLDLHMRPATLQGLVLVRASPRRNRMRLRVHRARNVNLRLARATALPIP